MNEEWRDVIGYEGIYQVSNKGQVRRIANRSDAQADRGGDYRILRQAQLPKYNYRFVGLCWNNVTKNHYVHRLVAEAFIGPAPKGQEVCHKDDDKTNNVATNLVHRTHQANCAERKYERPSDKQDLYDVVAALMKSGQRNKDIAGRFGLTTKMVSWITHHGQGLCST